MVDERPKCLVARATMDETDVERTLREVLRHVLPRGAQREIDGDADLVLELGLDSLDLGNLVVELEHAFAVALSLEQIGRNGTLRRLTSLIMASLRGREPQGGWALSK